MSEHFTFQGRVQPWLLQCFGAEIANDKVERSHRFLEEALELVQSIGCTQSEAHQLVDYVFGRPVGDPVQETGGVMVTLAALCLANGIDMQAAGDGELARIWDKIDKIRAKQAAKPKHGPLPEHVSFRPPMDSPEFTRVKAERERQMHVEGWSREHDDSHDQGQLCAAARCYFNSATRPQGAAVPVTWPWSVEWWKPKGPMRDLERAGALCLAEIDRVARSGYREDISDVSQLLDDILAAMAALPQGAST